MGVVVEVIRATSSIAQALASGDKRVLSAREIAEAIAPRADRIVAGILDPRLRRACSG